MKKYLFLIAFSLFFFYLPPSSFAATYYISPTGNDNNNGISVSAPIATFSKAWEKLFPGDTLYLLDGVYKQRFQPNRRNGKPNPDINKDDYITYPVNNPERIKNYIKIRALNDGKAIIDGEGIRVPVFIGECWAGTCPTDPGESPVGNYFYLEGVIARNSSWSVYEIWGINNILKSVSGYNANSNENAHIITIRSEGNVVEDALVAGSGRKMAFALDATHATFRRVFALWQEWKGANFCPGEWPWGESIESYNSSYTTIENSIAYGTVPSMAINVFSQGGYNAVGNKVLGSIAMRAGMTINGGQINWPCPNPYNQIPDNPTCLNCTNFSGNDQIRAGFHLGNRLSFQNDNLFQDIFAWGNGGLGLSVYIDPGMNNNRVVRATLVNNGIGNPIYPPIAGKNASLENLTSITDSNIPGTSFNGSGARLRYRYINGTLTPQELWPWPMEERIKRELADPSMMGSNTVSNFSVTNTIVPLINQYTAEPIPSGTSTPTPTSVPCPLKSFGDTDCSNQINLIDLSYLMTNYGKTDANADLDFSGKVNMIDLSILIKNFGRTQ